MERNIRLYFFYALAFNTFAWVPVFFLFFSSYLPLEKVLQLEAFYYLSVVLLEVPSGYFSDKIGRKPTLFISSSAFVISYGLFSLGSSFAVFLVAQLFLAIGISFNSGTDTALLHDSLKACGREAEYGSLEARFSRLSLVASGIGCLVGGAFSLISLRGAYVVSLLTALMGWVVVLLFQEPEKQDSAARHFLAQLKDCVQLLKSPLLLWLFGLSVLIFVLNHIPYEFFQPYLNLLTEKNYLPAIAQDGGTPLYSALVMAGAMLLGAWVAGYSIRLKNKFGLAQVLLLATALQIGLITTMGSLLHPVVYVLILMRSVPRALLRAPFLEAIAPRVGSGRHATFLSINSLASRGIFSGVLASLSILFADYQTPNWEALQHILRLCAGLGLFGFLILILTIKVWREPS